MPEPFIIGISGGMASGKSSVCKAIFNSLGEKYCSHINIECFYKTFSPLNSGRNNYEVSEFINSFDFAGICRDLQNLKKNLPISLKVLNEMDEKLTTEEITPTKIILIEGDAIFFRQEIRDLLDLKIFIRTDDDERLARKLLGLDKEYDIVKAIEHYRKYEKPVFDTFVGPTIRFADVIIPRGGDNGPAIDILERNLARKVSDSYF